MGAAGFLESAGTLAAVVNPGEDSTELLALEAEKGTGTEKRGQGQLSAVGAIMSAAWRSDCTDMERS